MPADQPTTFTADFYQNWLAKLCTFLVPLQALSATAPPQSNPGAAADHDDKCLALVDTILDHFVVFLEEKSKACRQNTYHVLDSPWLTSYERTLSWFSWFKPTVVFTLAKKALGDEFKPEKIEEMRTRTRTQEMEIEVAMDAVKENIEAARQPLCEMMSHGRDQLPAGERAFWLRGIQGWIRDVVRTLIAANVLRERTTTKLLEIMSPVEAVKFFVCAVEYIVQNRELGLDGDRIQAMAKTAAAGGMLGYW